MLKRLLSVVCLMCAMSIAVSAQEFNCKVTVMHDKITGVDGQVFADMQKAFNDFMNSHKWSNDDFAPAEKIDCNIFINLLSNKVGGDNDSYTASFSIQATRPVYNSGYTSTLVNYVDKDVAFKYTQFNALRFDE